MWAFATFCDEFYVTTRLRLKLQLEPSRETLLHFCEQIRRAFPSMTRFRRRPDGSLVLDEPERHAGGRRYLRIDPHALRFGHYSPPNRAALTDFARVFFSYAPHVFSLSDLDYERFELTYGFDLEYAGNHDELVAETLLGDSGLPAALFGDHRRIINCQPYVGVALTPDCDTQAYVDVRGRSTMYELRSGEYEPELLSVYLTVRREFRDGAPADLGELYRELLELGEDLVATGVMPHIVRPLREAIASRR